ncbi:unnamed protein product [Penicillium glandicola]
MLLTVDLEPDVIHLVNNVLKPAISEHLEDVIILPTVECANTLRSSQKFKAIPVVLLYDEISVSMKSALDLSITSYVTTPCRTIDLANAKDNEVNQMVAMRVIEKYHHHIAVVGNGQEALDEFCRGQDDVVFMDVQMPVMGGFKATTKIRQYGKFHHLSRTQIIALTAHAMFEDRERCIAAGMDDYLAKPLNQMQMMEITSCCRCRLDGLCGWWCALEHAECR